MVVQEIPRLRDGSLWVGAEFGDVSERVKEMAVAASRISTAQRRISAFPEEARTDFLYRNKIVLAHSAQPRRKALLLILVRHRGLMHHHSLWRLSSSEFLVAFDDELHQSFRASSW